MRIVDPAYIGQESYEREVIADHDVPGWEDPNQGYPMGTRSAELDGANEYEHFKTHTPPNHVEVSDEDVCLGVNGERHVKEVNIDGFFLFLDGLPEPTPVDEIQNRIILENK